jgi:plasmid stability protein
VEDRVVARLRQRAAQHGTSMEEEHRRILREALLGSGAGPVTLKEYLAAMPDVGDDEMCERAPASLRPVDL